MAQAMLPSWLVGNLSYGDLCVAVSNGRSAVHWCQRHHLIPNSKQCPRCGRYMNLADRGSGPEGLAWRCPRKGCRKEVSIVLEHFLKVKVKKYKIFSDNHDYIQVSHLEIATILRIIHLWCMKTAVGKMAAELSVSHSR